MTSILLSLLWLVLIPLVIGTGFSLILQRNLRISLLQYYIGFLFMAAIFQLLAVPIIYKHGPLHTLVSYFRTIILLIFLVCLLCICVFLYIKYKKSGLHTYKDNAVFEHFSKNPYLAAAFLLIFIQLILMLGLHHIDDDDSRFIASSVVALETDSMYRYHPVTGDLMDGFIDESYKDVTSPLSIYYATLSSLTSIHPAVIAHTFTPLILVLFYYTIMYRIGMTLFQSNLKRTGEFLLFMAVLNLFGCSSPYTSASFLMLRLWQGKSMVANISIPLILLCYMKVREKNNDYLYWFILLLTMLFSCLCSGNGIALPLILVGVCALIISIKVKRFSVLVYSGLCCIPNIYFGLFYYKIVSSVLWLDWAH